jgi:hypothetical protein
VGTEQGTVIGYNSKQKRVNNGLTNYDLSPMNKHHGVINAIQRNPVHTKFFLTVKYTHIMHGKVHMHALTCV